jgi:L-amino acid N-acyltransferase YncA
MAEPLLIRPATEADPPSLLAIYRPSVEATATSFETVVPTVEEFAARISKALSGWQWLVAERNGQCAGYAYGSSHRDRRAYRWSVEVSAYVHPDHQRRGIGRTLYLELLPELARRGFCNAYAGITLPNEGSVGLHRSGWLPAHRHVQSGWPQIRQVARCGLVSADSPRLATFDAGWRLGELTN